ncbi:MAG: hypothetical protein MJ252_12475 [archaeon]|nr:hypothetical protein [archaeon]
MSSYLIENKRSNSTYFNSNNCSDGNNSKSSKRKLNHTSSKRTMKDNLLQIDSELSKLRKKIEKNVYKNIPKNKIIFDEQKDINYIHYNDTAPKINPTQYQLYKDYNQFGKNTFTNLDSDYNKSNQNINYYDQCKEMEKEIKEKNIMIHNLMNEIKN